MQKLLDFMFLFISLQNLMHYDILIQCKSGHPCNCHWVNSSNKLAFHLQKEKSHPHAFKRGGTCSNTHKLVLVPTRTGQRTRAIRIAGVRLLSHHCPPSSFLIFCLGVLIEAGRQKVLHWTLLWEGGIITWFAVWRDGETQSWFYSLM